MDPFQRQYRLGLTIIYFEMDGGMIYVIDIQLEMKACN